ncbi:hypothetical protein [Treponema sp.]|uniref:hypothetical protein n=1 Tax=Treponema sp. TaxID=166 RepID=UPI00298DF375|nr:hypothetical protein [Treponema sp.]MCR5613962.1 hypothetical protein [Treponema sp.]
MKKFFAILACVAAVSCFYAQEASTEELVNPKNPMDRTVTVIVPENQRITVNPETGKQKPASVKLEYLENYDEVHVYYTCLDVAFDKGDAMVTIADVLEDFQKEHGYVRYSYLRRDKTRHYKDERGIKMGEMLCIVKFYR